MTSLSKSERFCFLLSLFCFLLLSYPLLQIFNNDTFITGVPLLFLYIVGVWVLAIIGLYAMSHRFTSPGLPDKQEPRRHDQ